MFFELLRSSPFLGRRQVTPTLLRVWFFVFFFFPGLISRFQTCSKPLQFFPNEIPPLTPLHVSFPYDGRTGVQNSEAETRRSNS